ncbi:inositol monophosphatase family protein [Streptococcus dentiloxodontae]
MESKLAFARKVIKKAGQFIKDSLTKELSIEEKTAHDDLVTNIDKATQDLMVACIREAYPDDNIFAEENDLVHDITDGNVWVLDPIDGTVNFIVQQENFCVMMAYYENGIGQFGLIYDVVADQLYYGGGSFEVYCNETLLPSYQPKELQRSLISSNAAMYAKNAFGIADLAQKTLGVRVYGGAGLSMSKVLKGQVMAYFSHIYPWDYAAASILGKKLGYKLVSLDGQELDYRSRQIVMFAPEVKLDEVLQIIHFKA